jgi:hypothetical protein
MLKSKFLLHRKQFLFITKQQAFSVYGNGGVLLQEPEKLKKEQHHKLI